MLFIWLVLSVMFFALVFLILHYVCVQLGGHVVEFDGVDQQRQLLRLSARFVLQRRTNCNFRELRGWYARENYVEKTVLPLDFNCSFCF